MSRIITRFAKRNRERRGADGEEKNASYTRERYKRGDIFFSHLFLRFLDSRHTA